MTDTPRAPLGTTMITLVMIDDSPIYRDGVERALHDEPDMQLVAMEHDGLMGMKAVRRLRPDVLLLDVSLPSINGLEVAHQLKRVERLATRIIMMTGFHDSAQARHVIRSGASAYTSKAIPSDTLVTMIRDVVRGYFVVDEQHMTPSQVQAWLLDGGQDAHSDGEGALSRREMEILDAVTRGLSNKEIAAKLHISQQTVKNHMTNILRKLNVEDRTQAAVAALRRGWVRLDAKDGRG